MNKNNGIKVSIIIPIYNVEKFLSDCLNSAINQTLKEIEIICVNDASSDNSLKIVNEYALNDNRIIVINQEINNGLSVTRNIGANIASGEFIYFLDSDDMITLNAMEKLYSKATQDNLDVVCFEGSTFFDTVELRERRGSDVLWCSRNNEYKGIKAGKQLMVEMAANHDYKVAVWILFIRRSFYENEKLSFIPGIIYEDHAFTFECMLKAKRVGHIHEELYIRRVRDDSITSTKIRTIRNPYGFFRSAIRMMQIADSSNLNVQERQFVEREITIKLDAARRLFSQLKDVEANKYKDFPLNERIIFEYLVAKPAPLQKEFLLAQKELNNVKSGMSFKIGRIITWLPRKLLGRK